MGKTGIEWTQETWNPVTGCSKVSPGCAHCYAEAISLRFGFSKKPWTPANASENVVLHPERLEQPLRWRKPRMVFVNSMSDLFHEDVPLEFLAEVWDVMVRCPQHTFQILTKRPERMVWALGPSGIGFYAADGPVPCPQPNIWLGVSIENRRYVHRADLLRNTPAAVRFISAEPLLGPLCWDAVGYEKHEPYGEEVIRIEGWEDGYEGPELDLTNIDWLIVGGESGTNHRPIEQAWVEDLKDLCLTTPCPMASDGFYNCSGKCMRLDLEHRTTAFFFKQWGGRTPKAGGRLLDGREWNEMPKVKELVA